MPDDIEIDEGEDRVDPEFVRLTPVRAISVVLPALLVGLLVAGVSVALWWFRAALGWHVWLFAVAVVALAVVGIEATRRSWRAYVVLDRQATLGMRRFLLVGATALSALWLLLGLGGGAEVLIRPALFAAAVPVIALLRRPDGPLGIALRQTARRLQPVLVAEAVVGLLALPVALVVSTVANMPDAFTYAAAAGTIYALLLAITLLGGQVRRRREDRAAADS